MSAPRAISGNQGRVIVGGSTIAEIVGWDGTLDFGVKTYVAQSAVSGNVGYQKTVQGNTKMSGSIRGLLDPNYAPATVLASGALVSLLLYEQYPNNYFSMQARIGTRTAGADFNSGDPIPFTATFESDGLVQQIGV